MFRASYRSPPISAPDRAETYRAAMSKGPSRSPIGRRIACCTTEASCVSRFIRSSSRSRTIATAAEITTATATTRKSTPCETTP